MERVLPAAINKALTDFKAEEMQAELKRARGEAVEKFKANDLPAMLQKEYDIGFDAFANSEKGEEYISGVEG